MLNKILEHKTEELPSLERFKMPGSKVVGDENRYLPVLICAISSILMIHGTAKGDWLVTLPVVDYFCRENKRAFGAMSCVDHLLVPSVRRVGDKAMRRFSLYQILQTSFLERVSEHYDRVKIHVSGLYVMQVGRQFYLCTGQCTLCT